MTQPTIEELTQLAADFLRKHYDMSLDISIRRNNRLRKCLGVFRWLSEWEPEVIELSGDLLTYGARDVVIDTLYHELIHYALFTQQRQFRDGEEDYESELRKHSVSSTGSCCVGLYYEMKCVACGGTWETRIKRVKTQTRYYMSRCCKMEIEYVSERIYNGTEAVS